MKTRKYLSVKSLYQRVRAGFAEVSDTRTGDVKITMTDALQSAFALFALKDPSLLAFEARRPDPNGNLRRIFGIHRVPSDTQSRTILDPVDPAALCPVFKDIFRQLQRGKALESYVFLEGCYLVSSDGTGYFYSTKIHCPFCLERKNSHTGEISYYHQLLEGVLVHPDLRTVIPLAPEPIIKQDGSTKNDCERNAAKRFWAHVREDHPHLRLIALEDALYANAPHILELRQHKIHYILGVKPGDHEYLFDAVQRAHQQGETTEWEVYQDGARHCFRWLNQVPLNKSHPDVLVNFLEYWEITPHSTQHFTWITDFTITVDNACRLMRGGRARWKSENETFNTLKNHGYHFEHNFGHGQQHLSVVLATLMLLAFLVDQAQQIGCRLFQAVLAKLGSHRQLWDDVRALFRVLPLESMEELYRALLHGFVVLNWQILYDSC